MRLRFREPAWPDKTRRCFSCGHGASWNTQSSFDCFFSMFSLCPLERTLWRKWIHLTLLFELFELFNLCQAQFNWLSARMFPSSVVVTVSSSSHRGMASWLKGTVYILVKEFVICHQHPPTKNGTWTSNMACFLDKAWCREMMGNGCDLRLWIKGGMYCLASLANNPTFCRVSRITHGRSGLPKDKKL